MDLLELIGEQGWSYRATNSTLRAIASAGLNEYSYPSLKDVIVVTEPEAAAMFTARSLKEDKNTDFLQVRLLVPSKLRV